MIFVIWCDRYLYLVCVTDQLMSQNNLCDIGFSYIYLIYPQKNFHFVLLLHFFFNRKTMSFNVASATSNLPTVEQMNEWSRDEVKTFLQGNITRLDLEGEDIDKIYTQRVKGNTFLDLTRDDLLAIKIPLG